jgi:hypothetical protein
MSDKAYEIYVCSRTLINCTNLGLCREPIKFIFVNLEKNVVNQGLYSDNFRKDNYVELYENL